MGGTIIVLGRVIGAVSEQVKAWQAVRTIQVRLQKLDLTEEMLAELDNDGDGDVDLAEWLKFCIKRLDLVDTSFMEVIVNRFEEFDTSGDGTLDIDDLLSRVDSVAGESMKSSRALPRSSRRKSRKLEAVATAAVSGFKHSEKSE